MYPVADASAGATLLLHALSDYTARMSSPVSFRSVCLLLPLCLIALSLPAQQAPPREPLEALAALNRIAVEPNTYELKSGSQIELRRGDGKLIFESGLIAFLTPVDGRVTGAVFSGRGHILAAPRDPVEKQQLAQFLGAPVVDQDFTSAYIRFTDDTAGELQRQFQAAGIVAQANQGFADAWAAAVVSRNAAHSRRILFESFVQDPLPYFFATLNGVSSGTFEFVFDQARDEPQVLGQGRRVANEDYYDVWSSYRPGGKELKETPYHATQYAIDTTIKPDNSLAGEAVVRLRATRGGERILGFQFSRLLTLDSAMLAGSPVFAFPRDPSTERLTGDSDSLFLLLPSAPAPGSEIELTLRYHGNVIRDAGNGVLFVGARESWYPHFGDASEFSLYDLTFHWPRRLRLAATGTKLDEKEEGEVRVGRWHTEKPACVAGFNLGEYAVASLSSPGHSIDVYANRQLEQALLERLRGSELADALPHQPGMRSDRMRIPAPNPSPADALKQLASEIDASIRFYELYSGPFPVKQLSVSQIPGTFGQGWPGLLYLSTYAFLSPAAQERAGLSLSSQEHFHDLVPSHEVAHQWWGNVVSWSSYRDQWIDEALASYLSLLFADSQKSADRRLRSWLDRFRKRLLDKGTAEMAPIDTGALVLGSRLNSSRTPNGFDELVYNKGAWVFHMLREMLREPAAKNPDARFTALLQSLQSKYAYRALSTEDLQRELEAVMTPAMQLEGRRSLEWFFADWIRGTGMPHYRMDYSVKRSEKGFVIRGKILQSGVPDSFVAPVPVYSGSGSYIGRIVAGGPETSFHFVTTRDPGKLQLDPQMTLLCVVDR